MEEESEKRHVPKLVPTGELANPWLCDASCHVLFAPHHDSAQNACLSISFTLCGPAVGPMAAIMSRTHPLYLLRTRHMRGRASPRLVWLCPPCPLSQGSHPESDLTHTGTGVRARSASQSQADIQLGNNSSFYGRRPRMTSDSVELGFWKGNNWTSLQKYFSPSKVLPLSPSL